MRLFFAIWLPDDVRAACERAQAELRSTLGDAGIRWTAPSQFHFTLKFLGETPDARLPAVISAAQEAASQSAAFTLTVANLGVLPSVRRPQLLYIGMEESGMAESVDFARGPQPDGENTIGCNDSATRFPGLGSLAECLDRKLSEQGFAPEDRDFYAHLTLARIKSPGGFKAVRNWAAVEMTGIRVTDEQERYTNFWEGMKKVDKIGVFEVKQFVLVSSELRRDGPIYTVLETFPLIAT
jgi:2'-5' RNA ligase